MSVENVSLSMNYREAPAFRSAGYAALQTNASAGHQGGLVRQHNRVSFSRVFEAGHDVAAYQPETVLRIFERAVFGRDVATGEVDVLSLMRGEEEEREKKKNKCKNETARGYSTRGPASVRNITNAVLDPVVSEPLCWWYTVNSTQSCTVEQIAAVADGTAVVEDWVVVSPPGVFSATTAYPAATAAAEIS